MAAVTSCENVLSSQIYSCHVKFNLHLYVFIPILYGKMQGNLYFKNVILHIESSHKNKSCFLRIT